MIYIPKPNIRIARNRFQGYILLFLFFWPLLAFSQNFLPPIYNYKVFEYNAGGQNWGVAINGKGEVFAANDKGLLFYNGEEWVLNKLPNTTILRSVAVIDDKIYTGSYEEFGYWEKNGTGEFEYTSLIHLVKGHTFTSEEFWQIISFGDAVIFRSFSALYIYEKGEMTVVDPNFVITNILAQNDRLWVAGKNEGLLELRNNEILTVGDNTLLNGKTVIDMVPYKDGLLIGTQLGGCFLYVEGNIIPFNERINLLLQQHQLNKILQLSSNIVAFGTIKNGIYLYDIENNTLKNLNRQTGLQNNTVLALAKFNDQIWAGLENGIDRILVNSSIEYYTDYTGGLGTVHDLTFGEDQLIIGSNTGLFYFESDDLQFLNGSQGHVWDIERIDGDILVGHNAGTFKVVDEDIDKISDIAGGYQFVKVPERAGTFLQGTYTGISTFERINDQEWINSKIRGIDFPIKQLCFENASTLWAAHPYKGLFRFKLDHSLTSVIDKQELGSEVLPNNYNIKLYRIKNQIVIQNEGAWYTYNSIMGEITPFEEFKPYYNKSLIYQDGDHFWFIDDTHSKELIYTDLRNNTISIVEMQLTQRMVPDMEQIIKKNDSIYLLTLTDGFAKINLSQLQNDLDQSEIPVPELSYFRDTKENHLVKDSSFRISFQNSRNLELQFSVPEITESRYYYELSGPMMQSEYTNQGSLNFQNLSHGTYRLKISTLSMDNKTSIPKIIAIEIAPPWYLSKLSMIVYFLALIGVFFLVRWYNRQKLKRKQFALKTRMEREQQEYLALLEKEKLEKEIKEKQKELARTTMSVAKKNELILELKDMLIINKEAFSNRHRYRTLTKKLDSSINEDEDWKHFEVNFKELHGDFFENLLKQYPNLTPKDLKLCAYLKMNLSSKEIAPLMGISIRGVEIHRYRLRKKLDMDSNQNLSNFLIKFN